MPKITLSEMTSFMRLPATRATPSERRQIAKFRRRSVEICRMPGGPYQAKIGGTVLAENGNLTQLLKAARNESRKLLRAFAQFTGF